MSKDSQELNLGPIGDKPTGKVKKAKATAKKTKATKALKAKGQSEVPALPISEPVPAIAPTLDLLKETVASVHPAAAVTPKKAKASSVTKELNLDSYAEERVAACIATFVNGHAAGWFFAVTDAFKYSLDIRPSERVFEGKKHVVMTQGKNFSFSRGDIIHGSNINLCVQVKDAIPAKSAKTKDYETSEGVQIFEDKSKQDADKKPKKDLYKIKFSRFQTDFGFVRCDVFDTSSGRYVLKDTYETDQEMFVRFLQTGLLRCNDGAEHDFAS